MALRRSILQSNSILNPTKYYKSLINTSSFKRKFSNETAVSPPPDKEVIYVNPRHAQDGYEIVNTSRRKPTIPALGFGTWGADHFSPELLAQSVDHALKIGYRHLDCARVYANEKEIGMVIQDHLRNGTFTRDELFVTSKLFNNEHAPPDGAPLRALQTTLKNLQLDYVDSFLIHWPFRNSIHHPPLPFDPELYFFTYKLLYEFNLQGLCRSIGICNATITKMKGLIDLCNKFGIAKPGILQIELHPYLQQEKVLQYAEDEDMIVTAAMPLGSPERPERFKRDDDPVIMDDPELKAIANETGYSVAQVIIRWHLQKGIVCIPKATEEWMIKENFEALNFKLNHEQMERINALDKHFRFARAEVFRWKENQPWEELFDYE